jgi:hypothetical protein
MNNKMNPAHVETVLRKKKKKSKRKKENKAI